MRLAGAGGVDHPHHVLGRKYHRGVDVERLVGRLDQIDRGRRGAALGMAVDRIDQILVEEIFRGELEALGVAVFPGGRAQIAGGLLCLRRNRARRPGGTAAYSRRRRCRRNHRGCGRARRRSANCRGSAPRREIVDGAVRHQHDRLACAADCALAPCGAPSWQPLCEAEGQRNSMPKLRAEARTARRYR